MESYKLISILLIFTIAFSTSARMLDEQPSNPSNAVVTPVTNVPQLPTPLGTQPSPSVAAATGVNVANPDPDHTLTFYMHDILGGSNPTALAVTGVVSNPAINGQLPFAKPNGANLPVSNGINQNSGNTGLINNNNIPFLTGLSGNTQAVLQNNGNNNLINGALNFPITAGGQLPSGSTLQKLMFGTMTVIDDELTVGHELGSGFLGKAQGFYVASSIDGTSQTMAFTAMFESSHYADTLSFFGVHRTGVSESHLAIMGGTGKYVNAKGFAIVKTIPATNQQQETDGLETVLEFTVYVTY
ncbi:dirigent protein 25-like [Durio zibethinus]|uniref:Dirigent protein n=1 Tax=Durio zibethinus TaxID=66656 RepID=A0A6P6AID0_DURZI|nr:dirigent protein 25-like [Durio zibethinus]